MTRLALTSALALALALALPAAADSVIRIEDAYARASGMGAIAGAAFMTIVNEGDTDDRVIAVASDAAERVELHTHLIDANGVARMVEVEDGFAVPAGASHPLQRGGDHVMLMGLTRPLADGDVVTLTLTFEQAGEITLDVPVDLTREGGHGMRHGTGG